MQIQINTDHNIEGKQSRDEWARGVVEAALGHLVAQVTRVEVHLGDENGAKPGGKTGDKRCVMEARLVGRPPLAVTHHADGLDAAVHGAAHKLVRLIEHTLGRAAQHANDPRVVPDAGDDVPVVSVAAVEAAEASGEGASNDTKTAP